MRTRAKAVQRLCARGCGRPSIGGAHEETLTGPARSGGRSMMTRSIGLFALIALTAGAAVAQQPADLILHNGKIAVVDEAFSIHQAIVVKDGKVVAVGGNDLATGYRATRVVDLRGRLVIPGFNDTHIHLTGH